MVLAAEVRTVALGRAVVAGRGGEEKMVGRRGEEKVPGLLPAAGVPRLLGVLAAAVLGTVPGAAVVLVLPVPTGTSYPVAGREVGGNGVGTSDVITDGDCVGEGATLLASTRGIRLSGPAVTSAVGWALPSLWDVKSSVALIVAPVSSSEARTVESRDEDTFKTGVVGKGVNREIRLFSSSRTLLVTGSVSEAGSTRVGTTGWKEEGEGSN